MEYRKGHIRFLTFNTIWLGAFAFSDNKLKNEKNVVFNLELLAFYYRPALILLNNGACSP